MEKDKMIDTDKMIDLDEVDYRESDFLKIGTFPTGIPSLDRMLGGGLRRGSLTLIASRPALGKTSLALQIAGNIAAAGKRVYFCSLEISKDGLNRILGKQSGSRQKSETLYFDDPTNADVPYITGMIHSLAKCDAVFIDYLQLFARRSTPKTSTETLSALKELALSENIPVVLTSQISRRAPLPDTYGNEVFRPELSDLLRSGVLTQDPDVIIFPFRETYDLEDTETTGKAELNIAKNRYGATGTIPVHWDPEKLIFEEQDE